MPGMNLFGRPNAVVGNANTGQIVERLKEMFRHAVGKNAGLTMSELYSGVFGERAENEYVKLFKCNLLYGAMNYMKKHTNYFITSDLNDKRQRVWFIIKAEEEAQKYCEEIDHKIHCAKQMKAKCLKHIQERKYLRLDETERIEIESDNKSKN